MASGRYRVVSRIGAGGMGVVYEAVNIATEGRVALKWLAPELTANPQAVDRFKLEARATGRIQHPNVVAIHDIAEEGGHLYIVMELLKGESLRARLSRGPLPLSEALSFMFPIFRGVAAAHGVGVLHRDLKPENIFLAESPDGLDPIPKVLDFGIAKLSSDSEKTKGATAHTGFLGTYPYMAFEQLHARGNLDARVDVYALGAVLYNSLTGRLPFEADNPVDLALRMMQGLPVSVCEYVPELPQGLSDVINKALARERDERYANVEAFAVALEPFAQGLRFRGAGKGASMPAPPVVAGEPTGPKAVEPLATPFATSRSGKLTGQSTPNAPEPTPGGETARPKKSQKTVLVAAVAALVLSVGAFAWLKMSGSDAPAPQAETDKRHDSVPGKPATSTPTPAEPSTTLPSAPAPTGGSADDWESAPIQAPPVQADTPRPAAIAAPLPSVAPTTPSPAPSTARQNHAADSAAQGSSSVESGRGSSRHSRSERAVRKSPEPVPSTPAAEKRGSRELMADPRLDLIGPQR